MSVVTLYRRPDGARRARAPVRLRHSCCCFSAQHHSCRFPRPV